MQRRLNVILFTVISTTTFMSKAQEHSAGYVNTSMGQIYYEKTEVANTTPVILLHGVYFDHNLWNGVRAEITSNTTIAIDMPTHGKSQGEQLPTNWNMDDVSNLLIELLDLLGIQKCVAIGHSWGSMTILRAAVQSPDKFLAVGLGNMPTDAGSKKRRRTFAFQHSMLAFRNFYTKQAAKSLFSPKSLSSNPGLTDTLATSMDLLTNRRIKQVDKAVITHVDDGRPYIEKLTVPVLGMVGEDDYVGVSSKISTRTVAGGHVSPLESQAQVIQFVKDVIALQ